MNRTITFLKMMTILVCLWAGMFTALCVSSAEGQIHQFKLENPQIGNPAEGDYFGYSVSISGDTAIVAAAYDVYGAPTEIGSAYVFTRSGSAWTQQAKLTASGAAAADGFVFSVAVSGDTAIIGAPYKNSVGYMSGSAYVFMRSGSTWTQQAKLTASDASALDQFGWSVAVSGDTAVVGAWYDDNWAGSAYVFTRSGSAWTQQQKLTAANAGPGDGFGVSVSVSGDTAVVGGASAYVFTRSGSAWTQQENLFDVAPILSGFSVAVSGDTAVVGVPIDNGAGNDSGSASVFTRSGSTWTLQAKLTASDAAAGDTFGYSVSVSGDIAVVGANGDDGGGSASGSAYVFTRSGSTWTQQAKLTASDAAPDDYFGYSVAIDAGRVIAGAYGNDDPETDSGAAYVFDLDRIKEYLLGRSSESYSTELDKNGDGIIDVADLVTAILN